MQTETESPRHVGSSALVRRAIVSNDLGDEFEVAIKFKRETAHYRPPTVCNSAAIRKARAAGLPESTEPWTEDCHANYQVRWIESPNDRHQRPSEL